MKGLKLAALQTLLTLRFITSETYDFKKELEDKKNGKYNKEIEIIGDQFTDLDAAILIANFSDLKKLTICQTSFESIPEELGSLKKLKVLKFENNLDMKQFPRIILNMENLVILKYNNCNLKHLPGNFGVDNLQRLEEFELTHSELSYLPIFLEDLVSLKKLTLNNNKIKNYYDSFRGFKKLVYLDLSSNPLNQMPESVEKLKTLETLIIKDCNLSNLHPEIGNLKNLKTLNLESNNLKLIPASIEKLRNPDFELFLKDNFLEKTGDDLNYGKDRLVDIFRSRVHFDEKLKTTQEKNIQHENPETDDSKVHLHEKFKGTQEENIQHENQEKYDSISFPLNEPNFIAIPKKRNVISSILNKMKLIISRFLKILKAFVMRILHL